jgi:methionyl aminopeptidase
MSNHRQVQLSSHHRELLNPGETIAIEPMATLGGEKIVELDDGWTFATRDGSLAAHFEHTVLITETGAEIITTK